MIRLAVRVRRADADIALAELLELAPSGVEEVDLGDAVEFAIYGAPGELPALPDLQAAAAGGLVDVSTTEVGDDWHERWRAFHRPVRIGDRLHVRPPWADPASPPELDVVIEPGQAFGTGAHETTRLCLELILELEPAGGLLDLGCGSGVLAIAAAKLGWSPVVALDNDPEAVRATEDNARANGAHVRAARHDLLQDGPVAAQPTVVANLLKPLLLRLAFAAPGPQALIVSGLLAPEADDVSAVLAAELGLCESDRRRAGEWAAVLLRRSM